MNPVIPVPRAAQANRCAAAGHSLISFLVASALAGFGVLAAQRASLTSFITTQERIHTQLALLAIDDYYERLQAHRGTDCKQSTCATDSQLPASEADWQQWLQALPAGRSELRNASDGRELAVYWSRHPASQSLPCVDNELCIREALPL